MQNVKQSAAMAKVAGIFALVNQYDNDKLFICATRDIDTIERRLFKKLNAGEHENKRFQKAWNKFGGECFELEILEVLDTQDTETIKSVRDKYILMYQTWDTKFGYNLTKPKEQGEIDIHKHLLSYDRDKTISTSKQRVESIKRMGKDGFIIDWVSSSHFRQSQVKNKRSPLAENDRLTGVLDKIAYWLVELDRDEWHILSNNALSNKGKGKKDEDGKRSSYLRTLPFSAFEQTDSEGNIYYTEDLEQSITNRNVPKDIKIDVLKWVDLSNPQHVMTLLKLSDVLEPTDGCGLDTLLYLLEDLLDLAQLDELDQFIVSCLRQRANIEDAKGYFSEKEYTYKEIHEMVQAKGFDCTYRKLEYRINKGIPNKLTRAYHKLYDNTNKKLEQRRPRLSKAEVRELWIDKEAQQANRERMRIYKKFIAKNQPIHIEHWTRDRIEKHLLDTYGEYKLNLVKRYKIW